MKERNSGEVERERKEKEGRKKAGLRELEHWKAGREIAKGGEKGGGGGGEREERKSEHEREREAYVSPSWF